MVSYPTFSRSMLAGMALIALPALASAAMAPGKDVQTAFQAAKVTLAQAIATVEKQTSGKITHAAFELQSGKPGYVITAVAGGKMEAMWVDPQSGAASTIAKPAADEASIETQDQAELPTFNSDKTSLEQAVAMAEQKEGGKALDAGLAKHGTALEVNVDIWKDGKLSTVRIDPAAGKILG